MDSAFSRIENICRDDRQWSWSPSLSFQKPSTFFCQVVLCCMLGSVMFENTFTVQILQKKSMPTLLEFLGATTNAPQNWYTQSDSAYYYYSLHQGATSHASYPFWLSMLCACLSALCLYSTGQCINRTNPKTPCVPKLETNKPEDSVRVHIQIGDNSHEFNIVCHSIPCGKFSLQTPNEYER